MSTSRANLVFFPLHFCILAFERYSSRTALNDHSPPFVSLAVARSSTLVSLPILMRPAGMVLSGAHGKITRKDVGGQTTIWLAVCLSFGLVRTKLLGHKCNRSTSLG